jgi:hypothetical protein
MLLDHDNPTPQDNPEIPSRLHPFPSRNRRKPRRSLVRRKLPLRPPLSKPKALLRLKRRLMQPLRQRRPLQKRKPRRR